MIYTVILVCCLLGQFFLCFYPPFPPCNSRASKDLIDLEAIRRLLRR